MKFSRKGSHNITNPREESYFTPESGSFYRVSDPTAAMDHQTPLSRQQERGARGTGDRVQHQHRLSDMCHHHINEHINERGIDCDGIVNIAMDMTDEVNSHPKRQQLAHKSHETRKCQSIKPSLPERNYDFNHNNLDASASLDDANYVEDQCNHHQVNLDDYDDIDDNCVIKANFPHGPRSQLPVAMNALADERSPGQKELKVTGSAFSSFSAPASADESSSISSFDPEPTAGSSATNDIGNGLRLVWQDVSFKLDTTSWTWDLSSSLIPSRAKINKEILQQQSGQVTSGQMVGIIGPSGAGKSTLLNCLTGRYRDVHGLKGSVFVNCVSNTLNVRRRIQVAFIPQRDNLFANFTVKETLIFASKMKNCPSTSHSNLMSSSTTSMNSNSLSESSISKVNFASKYSNDTKSSCLADGARTAGARAVTLPLAQLSHEEEAVKVMKYLNLTSCANTRIKRCSGGQVKRVCIGVELISSPDLLVLDEPTTGLDSSTAYQCVSILKKLTQPLAKCTSQSKSTTSMSTLTTGDSVLGDTIHTPGLNNSSAPAILATIHQPSCKILNKFDLIYLLSKNGQCLYFGPPGDIKGYFTHAGLTYPLDYNPADFAIETAYGDYGEEVFGKLSKLAAESARNIIASYDASSPSHTHQQVVSSKAIEMEGTGNNGHMVMMATSASKCPSPLDQGGPHRQAKIKITSIVKSMESRQHSFCNHVNLLLQRNWIKIFRDSGQLYLRIFQNIAIALMISFLWNPSIGQEDGCWNDFFDASIKATNASSAKASTLHKISSINSNTALLFALLIYIIMVSVMSTVLSFPSETLVVIKEMKNNWYSCTTYYISKVLAEIPILTLMILLLAGIIYPMTGQIAVWWRFGLVFLVASIMAEVCSSIGMLFGTIFSSDLISACFSSVASGFPPILFGGFVVPINQIRWYLLPFAYTSYLKYAFESLLIAIYGFNRCSVKPVKGNVAEDIAKAKNPIELIGTLVSSFNLTSKDANTFALLLNVDTSCVEGVINGTIDYFGINREVAPTAVGNYTASGDSDDYEEGDYSDIATTTLATPTYTIASQARSSEAAATAHESASYVLSYFGLSDEMIYTNVIALVVFMLVLKLLTFYVLRRKTRK